MIVLSETLQIFTTICFQNTENMVHTVVTFRRLNITVTRAWSGFNFSLIYRGPDEYEEKDTGLFVARVIPGGK